MGGQRPNLVVVSGQEEAPTIAELVESYLRYRVASISPRLSSSRVIGLERALRVFADVVGTTPLDAGAVSRWIEARSHLAPLTRYDEFCVVRGFCTWLGDRRYVTPIDWNGGSWPKRSVKSTARAATEAARQAEHGFEEYLFGVGLCQRSVSEYVHELLRARAWLNERGHDLETAPPSVVGAYADTRPSSWSTRKMVRATLGHYWTMTERPKPPLGAIRVPPKPRGRCRALEEDDSAVLAAAARARGDDPGLAVCLMLYAGLRRTEVAELRWECFDRSMEWMTIRGKLGVEATVPVHPRLRALLLAKGRSEGWVFPGRFEGRPSTSARIWHWVRRVAEEAGIQDVAPHRLRHLAIATVNDATGDLRAAQDFARHADCRVTAIYTRTTERRLVAAVASIEY